MTPIETELVLGFTRANGEQTISTVKGDTERFVRCTLVEDLLNYVVSDDVNYVVLKGVYSNGEIITPVILSPTYSADRTEMTFQIDPTFTQVSGVAKCVIVFLHCDDVPEFDKDGNLISFDADVLTSENFRLYVQADVLEDGCYSAVDTVAVSSLVPLVIYAQEAIKSIEDVEENENVRIANETRRNTAEAVRQTNENTRQTNEAARQTNEDARDNAETARGVAETVRVQNENERIAAEKARGEAENAREDAEEFRQEAEAARAEAFTEAIEDADAATDRANAIAEDLEDKVSTNYYAGKDFDIAATYPTIEAMEEDYDNPDIDVRSFVMITSNVEDPDNAKLYIKTDTGFSFVTDMSGATGLKGDKGEKGDAATISVGSVTSGAEPSITNSGTSKDAVFDFVLPKGDKGDQGEAATIAIGDVTSGDEPSVTNSGTSTDAVLDFVLPKGEKGDQGDQGESISKIEKTGTSGLVDTYTITTTDGNTFTFTVTNGADGQGSVSTVNHVPSVGGNITLTPADLGLGNVDNTSDTDKPVSAATQDALDSLANDLQDAIDEKLDTPTGDEGQLLGFDMDGNVVAMDAPETTPIATADIAGKMKPDDVTVHVDEDGVLSVDPSAASALLISGGKICINYDNLNTD